MKYMNIVGSFFLKKFGDMRTAVAGICGAFLPRSFPNLCGAEQFVSK
jgi:hypothetical protein